MTRAEYQAACEVIRRALRVPGVLERLNDRGSTRAALADALVIGEHGDIETGHVPCEVVVVRDLRDRMLVAANEARQRGDGVQAKAFVEAASLLVGLG